MNALDAKSDVILEPRTSPTRCGSSCGSKGPKLAHKLVLKTGPTNRERVKARNCWKLAAEMALQQPEDGLLQSAGGGVESKAVGTAQGQPHGVACEWPRRSIRSAWAQTALCPAGFSLGGGSCWRQRSSHGSEDGFGHRDALMRFALPSTTLAIVSFGSFWWLCRVLLSRKPWI